MLNLDHLKSDKYHARDYLYGPAGSFPTESKGQRIKWLNDCERLLNERRLQEQRTLRRKMAIAIAFHLELLVRRWRRKTLLRRELKRIFKVAILRWSVAKMHRVAECRRLLGNMVRMFQRAQKRGAWAVWGAMVEEARDRQARAHYRRVLQHKCYVLWGEGVMRARRQAARARAFRIRHLLEAMWRSWLEHLSGLRAFKHSLEMSGERGRRVVLGVAMRHWALVAHEMTLALMWTGTSLHKALLMLLKKEVLARWLRFNRQCRAISRIFKLIQSRLLRAAWRRLREKPPKSPKMQTPRPQGRPRRGNCRCVYEVPRTGKCTCSLQAHMMRRLALCHDLLDEGLAIGPATPPLSHTKPHSQRKPSPTPTPQPSPYSNPPTSAYHSPNRLVLDLEGLPPAMAPHEGSYRPRSVLFPHSTSSHW